MSDNWNIIDFKDLMGSILNGKRNIQEPISISNKRRDTVSKISFLNLLISYNNVNKDNLLDVLINIYKRFHNRINGLKKNKLIENMMESINQEWYDPDYMFIIQFPFTDDFFEKNVENKSKYDRSCKICEEIKNLTTIEHNIPFKLEKTDIHPLDKHFTAGIDICSSSISYIENNLEEIKTIIQSMRSQNMSQIIDISIKHKALYLKLSDKDIDDESIPEDIHHIFSNFIHIHNLLLKQLVQYYHFMLELLNEIKERCQTMNNLQQNIKSIAYFNEEEKSVDDDDDDDDLYIEDGNIYSKNEKESSFF